MVHRPVRKCLQTPSDGPMGENIKISISNVLLGGIPTIVAKIRMQVQMKYPSWTTLLTQPWPSRSLRSSDGSPTEATGPGAGAGVVVSWAGGSVDVEVWSWRTVVREGGLLQKFQLGFSSLWPRRRRVLQVYLGISWYCTDLVTSLCTWVYFASLIAVSDFKSNFGSPYSLLLAAFNIII